MPEPSQSPSQQPITVRLLFFGAARDAAAGRSETEFTLPADIKAAEAFERVLSVFPDLRRFGRSLLFAVNQEYADKERVVENGDELAIFPPVSGGHTNDAETRGVGETEIRIQDFFELTTERIDV